MNPQQYYGGQFGTGNIQPSQKKQLLSRRNVLVGVFLGLTLLAIVVGLFSVVGQNPADKLMGKAIKGDVKGSYALLGPKAKNIFTEVSWGTEVKVLSDIYSSYKLNKKSSKKGDNGNVTTTYTYTLKSRDAKSTTVAWVIVKTENTKEDDLQITDYQYHSLK